MINIFYKIIHNRFSRFFKFIFFLRYLFIIFFISIILFLIIPYFFNYEKRAKVVKDYLIENYNFQIDAYSEIKFKALPAPKIEINDATINFGPYSKNSNVKRLEIYLKLSSIYNYENFRINKINFKDSKITLEVSSLNFFIKQLLRQKKKLSFENLSLKIINKDNPIINLENIKFANFGYKKNLIIGTIFNKGFRTKIEKDFNKINFKLLNSGMSANINFDPDQKKGTKSGIFKLRILNTNLKFNFYYDTKELKIFNSYFRSKNLSFDNNTLVKLEPFLDLNSKFDIREINTQIFKKINLDHLFKEKDIIKKINSKNIISFKSKKFTRNFIDELNLNINLTYGRANYSKNFYVSDNFFQCDGNINLLEDYPLLFFDCSVNLKDKQKLLKKFSIKTKVKEEDVKLKVIGNLSIFNNKINFKNISMNDNYIGSKDDLKYFKNTFENILFNDTFLEIFNLKKIKEFILEIS